MATPEEIRKIARLIKEDISADGERKTTVEAVAFATNKPMFQVSNKINELIKTLYAGWDERGILLTDLADSSCTNGYDNDGSTGFEIFGNGFQLAQKAGGRPVFVSHDEQTALFFIGTEEEILRKLNNERSSDSEGPSNTERHGHLPIDQR